MQRTPRKLSEGLLIREAIQKNCFETHCKNGFGPPPQKAFSLIHIIGIHSKSDFLNLQVAAIFCDFPPKSWQRTNFHYFNDLCTFVAKFCYDNLRTFFVNFLWLKSSYCQLICCLDVCLREHLPEEKSLSFGHVMLCDTFW